MADKIASDIRSLALSLHTDLTTLNTYGDHPVVAAALADIIRVKLHSIRAAVDAVAGTPHVAPRGWDSIEAGTDQAADAAAGGE